MAEASASDSGQGEDPGRDSVPGGSGSGAPRDKGDPNRDTGHPDTEDIRGFAQDGRYDQAWPGVALTPVMDRVCGPDRRCDEASDDELFGLLGRWEATEAWCASAKLGVIREAIRRRAQPGREASQPGGLPSAWQDGLVQEVSNQIAVSLRAADALIDLAWTLEARLTLTAAALDTGVISLTKARIIAGATSVLSDEQAAVAETMIAGDLVGKTPGQIAAMIARAVVKVDPDGARKRREKAQREEARVEFWREHAGTAALAAFGLPPDEALAANQHIQDTALAYRAAGVKGTLDQLRVRAFLDALTGTDSRPPASATFPDSTSPGGETPVPETSPPDGPASDGSPPDGPAGDDTAAQGRTAEGAAAEGAARDGTASSYGSTGTEGPGLAANTMLTVPLTTLLSLTDDPGEAHGLGVIDPALARQMAAAAVRDPRSTWCVTVTDGHGHAIGHGCAKARPARQSRQPGRPGQAADQRGAPDRPASRAGPSFTQADDRGPPGGYGTWQLTMGGQQFTVSLLPIPLTDCDHRYQSAGYQPSALLRHLVQVRDGHCTQPTCVRSARGCDFEHAQPWHKGGRTCTCNCGCRCRRDHKVKQSPGWQVEQLPGGYHQWTTPSGRTYTKEPMKYPI